MCLCSASQNVLFRDFQGAIRAMEITHLSLTPTVAALVEPNNVPLVRFLVTAGEAVSAKVFQSWAGKGLFQGKEGFIPPYQTLKSLGYGPSETTNICTVKSCVVASDTINNIGPPLRNTSAFVIQGSAKLLMVPKGGIGELCFGGDQVFRGYLDMPALNSEKLIDHPKFGRLYRSGDYGRILWDGSLEYIRRQDDQVKIRGQRVELGEINSAILRSPDTLDVVTLIQQTKSRSQRILTFWVPKSQSSSEWCDINYNDVSKQALNGLYLDLLTTLPSYMIPSLIIPIPCVPMTAQEKVDKRRLIELASDLSQEDLERFSQPIEHGDEGQQWSELENMILRTLCASMNCSLDDVGRRTSFHSLGLDSISAVSFAKCLRDLGFPKADASIVLKHPSILLLSNFLAQNKDDQEPENNVSINVHMVFDQTEKSRICQSYENSGLHILKILPCTPLQEAMLASFTSDTHNTYYNHTIFEIHGDLDRLFKVWTNIVAKFDILRTAFTATKDKDHSFAQIVFSSHDIDWTTIETLDENLPAALNDRMTQVTRIASGYNPPYSLTAFKTERKTNLLLSMHHALYDGEAIQLLLDEIKNAYDGTSMPPAVPFESFLEYQLSLDLDKADDFWKTLLKSFHPMAFPGRFLNPASVQGEIKPSGTFITQFSSAASLESLENDCKKLSITLLSLFQASWARLLSLYIGHTDVCFGNVVNGRTVPLDGVEKIIAPCFNTLPVRMQLTSSMSNLELINNANAYNLQILPYQFTPLRRISRNCSHDSSRLFDTLFILQKPQVSLDNHIWSVKRDIGIMDVG